MQGLLVMVLLTTGPQGNSPKRVCTAGEARQAEQESSRLSTWKAIHQSHTRFSHCDDGAVAEGYSDSITKVLADGWNSVAALRTLWPEDPHFRDFVLRHIDETVPRGRLEGIAANAEQRCPRGSGQRCPAVGTR